MAKSKSRGIPDNLTVLLFLVVVILIVAFVGTATEVQTRNDQQILLSRLVTTNERVELPAVVVDGTVEVETLKSLAKADYAQVKSMIGIRSDFIIHFEDENGNLIEIENIPCIGSGYAQVSGHTCE
ncbi:hypothetical protein HYX10_02940 [Candidatus Woesearchaeota archaeon]|nr:hypothetical protein [Candidatus Woesearchaeota archaeon]